jgi:hypothetical protein
MTATPSDNLERRDLLAAAVDQLLDAADQREVAVLVQDALVAWARAAPALNTPHSAPY